MSLDEQALRDATHDYWRWQEMAQDAIDAIQKYICSQEASLNGKSLLAAELEWASDHGRINVSPSKTLVLLVGFAPEPLLQSICCHEPGRIRLILNRTYGGGGDGLVYGSSFQHMIELLWTEGLFRPEGGLKASYEVICHLTDDDPAAVFQTLLEALADEEETGTVIDITGGKKSMMTGAFLYAAFAGVPISYVDFEDSAYEVQKGRPRGYGCRIGYLSNPFQAFGLREWGRVRELYSQYNFHQARLELVQIKSLMKAPLEGGRAAGRRLFDTPQINAVSRLERVLECYECWECGDFERAKALGCALQADEQLAAFQIPASAYLLGDAWPYSKKTEPKDIAEDLLELHRNLEGGVSDLRKSFYAAGEALLEYAEDEFQRIGRLIEINEDYRSALLRAASLSETLIKARLFRLWEKGELVVERSDEGCGPEATWHIVSELEGLEIERRLAGSFGMGRMIMALCWKPEKAGRRYVLPKVEEAKEVKAGASGKEDAPKEVFYAVRKDEKSPELKKFWKTRPEARQLDEDKFTKLRNKAIHTVFAIPPVLARAAMEWTKANLEDYREHWTGLSASVVSPAQAPNIALPWSEVCALCKLTFLPKNLQRDPEPGGTVQVPTSPDTSPSPEANPKQRH